MNLDEDQFLAGPDGDIDAIDVDPIFGKEFSRFLEEAWQFGSMEDDLGGVTTPSDVQPGYFFKPVKDGLLLISPDGEICGGYISCDICVADEHRGQGLGSELIVEIFLRNGDLPVWQLDAAAYSPAGEAAHRSAWRMLSQEQELIEQKTRRIEAAGETPAICLPSPSG